MKAASISIGRCECLFVCVSVFNRLSIQVVHVHVGLCIVLFMRRSVALTLCTFQLTLIQQRVRRSPGLISYISYITSPVTCVAFVTEKNTLWRRLAEGDPPPQRFMIPQCGSLHISRVSSKSIHVCGCYNRTVFPRQSKVTATWAF